jgi:hypothetical protein
VGKKLTQAQVRFLSACREFEKGPMPRGLSCMNADMRTHGALLERNLIAINPHHSEYVLTPAGRLALEEHNGK